MAEQFQDGKTEALAKEPLIITPDLLWEDNHAPEAVAARGEWGENRRHGRLTLVFNCGDARGITPNPTTVATVRKIAAGGEEVTQYTDLFGNRGVKDILVFGHFDSEVSVPGQMPRGCGGLMAKETQHGDEGIARLTGIESFIQGGVNHPDPILQAYHSASLISRLTGKVVNVGIQNHRTGEILPVGGFWRKRQTYVMSIDPNLVFHGRYRPEEIYEEELVPHLPDSQVNAPFLAFLKQHREDMMRLTQENPNLYDSQRVQNPSIVALSTDIRPFREVRFATLGGPNTTFQLHLPRTKVGNDIAINPTHLQEALDQAEYPITHSTENHGKNGAFSDTSTFYIETGSLPGSIAIAEALVQIPWMGEWLSIDDSHQVIVAEIRSGEILRIQSLF